MPPLAAPAVSSAVLSVTASGGDSARLAAAAPGRAASRPQQRAALGAAPDAARLRLPPPRAPRCHGALRALSGATEGGSAAAAGTPSSSVASAADRDRLLGIERTGVQRRSHFRRLLAARCGAALACGVALAFVRAHMRGACGTPAQPGRR
jgi:hypothetical protein